MFVTLIHQTTNFVFPNFSQFEQFKKITNFLLVQNRFFFVNLGPMKSLFSFSTALLRKFRGKNWGEQDSWIGDSMSWIDTKYILEHFSSSSFRNSFENTRKAFFTFTFIKKTGVHEVNDPRGCKNCFLYFAPNLIS